MSAPRAAAQLPRMPVPLGYSVRPLLRGRGWRSAPSLPSRQTLTADGLGALALNQGNRVRSSPSLPTQEEERAGERSCVFIGFPLSPTLSPLVPRRERESDARPFKA